MEHRLNVKQESPTYLSVECSHTLARTWKGVQLLQEPTLHKHTPLRQKLLRRYTERGAVAPRTNTTHTPLQQKLLRRYTERGAVALRTNTTHTHLCDRSCYAGTQKGMQLLYELTLHTHTFATEAVTQVHKKECSCSKNRHYTHTHTPLQQKLLRRYTKRSAAALRTDTTHTHLCDRSC